MPSVINSLGGRHTHIHTWTSWTKEYHIVQNGGGIIESIVLEFWRGKRW